MGVAGNAVAVFTPIGNNAIDGMLMGCKFTASSLPYSFPSDDTTFGSSFTFNNVYTQTQKDCAAFCYAQIARFTGKTINFLEESGAAHGVFRGSNYLSGPSGAFPSNAGSNLSAFGDADVTYIGRSGSPQVYDARVGGTDYASASDVPFVAGQLRWWALHHEIGHTAGCKHTDQTSSRNGGGWDILAARNTDEYVCMIGGSFPGNETNGLHMNYPEGTILAFQTLMGTNATFEADRTHKWDAATGEYTIDGVRQWLPDANRVNMTWWKNADGDKFDLTEYAGGTFSTLPDSWITFSSAQLSLRGGATYTQGNVHLCSFGGRLADLELGDADWTIEVNGADQDWLGGTGRCEAVLHGDQADYAVTQNGPNDFTLTDTVDDRDGATRLRSFSFATFNDNADVPMSDFDSGDVIPAGTIRITVS